MAATSKASAVLRYPGAFKTIEKKLATGIWPWTDGIRSRLPLHYKKRYIEKYMREPLPVNYRPETGKFTVDKYGQRVDVQNMPIYPYVPIEADAGLWGGEGFLLGIRKKLDKIEKPRVYHLWKPMLLKRALYSEIMDQWMIVTVTLRTLDQIDKAFGFDHYILKTHEVDLKSKLGMSLRRKLLMMILHRTMYPNDPEKRDAIYEKYKEYLIPEEEIEWLGLSIEEAERKLEYEEEELQRQAQRPLKEKYMEELIQKMRNHEPEEEEQKGSLIDKFTSPFKNS